MTVGELLPKATGLLEHHHIPSARLTAEVLLAHVIDRERAFLYAHPEYALSSEEVAAFIDTVERRSQREPLQYITGKQEFYGREFAVNPGVLIPRPETELLVDCVLRLNRWPRPRVLDVGTGSGCIATTLALELPDSTVYASDITSDAVETAGRNARANNAPVLLAIVDLLEAWSGSYEFIVSNPPYISARERTGLQAEVRRYEPAVALFGDLDPITMYSNLIARARQLLVPGGYLVLEMGYSMEETVRALFDTAWQDIDVASDLQGFPRVVTARAPDV